MIIGAPIWEAHQAGALDERWFFKNMPGLLDSVWVTIGMVITFLASTAVAVFQVMSLWHLLSALFSGSGKPVR